MKVISFNDLRPVKGIPYSKSQLRRLEKAGQFPKRIQLTKRCVAWLETDLDAWIRSKLPVARASDVHSSATDPLNDHRSPG